MLLASLLILLAPRVHQVDSTSAFLKSYDALWQESRLLAMQTQTTVTLTFNAHQIQQTQDGVLRKTVDLPVNWTATNQQIYTNATGYTAPKTLKISTPKGELDLIYSIAGGDYRVNWP